MTKRILVTGGAGFIGSNICEFLVLKGHEVICFDNLTTGKFENIQSLMNYKNFQFILGDIRDYKSCEQSMNEVDVVLHQAALGSVPRSIKNPIETNNVNITGFLNILEAAKRLKVAKVIYAASSSTYGDSSSLPKVESKIGNPLSPYAITKLVNEQYAKVFYDLYGLNTIGLRYFNVYGRKQNPQGAYAAVIPKFIKSFLNRTSPIINGDGSYSRDFTYIDDVLQMIQNSIIATNSNALNQIYNTAYGESTTITQLGELIKDKLSKRINGINNIQLEYSEPRKGDIPHSLASIEKSKKLLKYNPQFPIEKGIELTVDWYVKNPDRLK